MAQARSDRASGAVASSAPLYHPIDTSWHIDLADPGTVYSNADFVFLATIDEILRVSGDHTEYRVSVTESVKGNLVGAATVSQLGFKEDDGVWQASDQPLFSVGEQYLLATNVDGDRAALTVLSGPVAGQPVGSGPDDVVALARELVESVPNIGTRQDNRERSAWVRARIRASD